MPQTPNPRRNAHEAGESARAAGSAQLDFLSEQTRHQMECGLQNMTALLQASEEIGQVQLTAAHQALERHQELQQQLHRAQDLPQLMRVQAEMWRVDSTAAARYWHDLLDATMRMSAQLMRGQMDLLSTGRSDAMKTAFQTVQSTWNSGLRPVEGLFNPVAPQETASHAGRHH